MTVLKRLVMVVFRITVITVIAVVVLPLMLRAATALWSRPKVFSADTAPQQTTAIVFGARVYGNGRPSAMLADRVAAGVELYHAGKVEYLLMSGAGTDQYYNEPEAMRRYALQLGVPDEAILIDEYGLRTYDTCYRAHTVYGIDDAVLVTQNFHLDRALLTCNVLGVESVGVFADDQRPWGYSRYSLTWSRMREIPATVMAVFDLLTGTQPTVVSLPPEIVD